MIPGSEDPLEKEMATHSDTLAAKSHGWRSLVGYSPWIRKESDTTEQLHFHFRIVFHSGCTNLHFMESSLQRECLKKFFYIRA